MISTQITKICSDSLIDWKYDEQPLFYQYFSDIKASSAFNHEFFSYSFNTAAHNILSKPQAVFRNNHCLYKIQQREDKSCNNDYHPSKDKLEIGVWWLVDYYQNIRIICFFILLRKIALFLWCRKKNQVQGIFVTFTLLHLNKMTHWRKWGEQLG